MGDGKMFRLDFFMVDKGCFLIFRVNPRRAATPPMMDGGIVEW
jgi:hypothetical protein